MMQDRAGRSSPGSARYRRRHSAPCRPRRATPKASPSRSSRGRGCGGSPGLWGVLLSPGNEKRVGEAPSREVPRSDAGLGMRWFPKTG